MALGFYVKVPEALADSLVEDGFRPAGTVRGADVYLGAALAASANLVTILVGGTR